MLNTEKDISICGVTTLNPDGSFSYYCGLSEHDKIITSNLPTNNKSQKNCTVAFYGDGKLHHLVCSEAVTPIKEYIAKGAELLGEWQCTGLDGYGGYDSEKISKFSLNENGTYQIYLIGKDDSDSVWHISDSIISGNFQLNSLNGLLLAPQEWHSKVIDSVGLNIEQAPQFMMVKPVEIKVESLTKTGLNGTAEFKVKESYTRTSHVQCKR